MPKHVSFFFQFLKIHFPSVPVLWRDFRKASWRRPSMKGMLARLRERWPERPHRASLLREWCRGRVAPFDGAGFLLRHVKNLVKQSVKPHGRDATRFPIFSAAGACRGAGALPLAAPARGLGQIRIHVGRVSVLDLNVQPSVRGRAFGSTGLPRGNRAGSEGTRDRTKSEKENE